MSVSRRQAEDEVRDGLEQLSSFVNAVGLSWDHDAFHTVQFAALAGIGEACVYCHAQKGDGDECPTDGSPHPWARSTAA